MNVSILYLHDSEKLYGKGIDYATPFSVGLDLRACFPEDNIVIAPGQRVPIPSGIAIAPDDKNTAGFVYSRSGLGAVKGLTIAQGVGVVDPDYRGELMIWLLNTSEEKIIISRGDRIAQLVFQPICRPLPVKAETLDSTERGTGGFGHTGRK